MYNIKELRYNLALTKGITTRRIIWLVDSKIYAKSKSQELLPITIYKHNSLIRRTLGDVDPKLQNNKAINLSLAAPLIHGILIRPGETFSLWKLVGKCTKSKGYQEGLVIKQGEPNCGVGGGMCQLSNLIHWMVLHSPLTITEHHHHNQVDLFPDYGRTIPFGTGTSIMYNYLDYQFTNHTDIDFQLLVYAGDEYLHGQLLASDSPKYSYHIVEEDSYFLRRKDGLYRHNKIYRHKIDRMSGDIVGHEFVLENLSKVLYDEQFIDQTLIKNED